LQIIKKQTLKVSTIIDTFKESLNGEQHDYTEGNIKKAVVLLAIPMILELSLESIFAVVDMFFVSKLGPNAIATVGLTESVITIVYSFAIGLSVAATAIVARRTGEKDYQEGAKSAAQAINISIGISAIITLVGLFFPQEILKLMGASEAVVRDGAEFTRIMLGGNLAIMLLFLINGIFRGAGNAAMAMKSLWIASIINIILCPILINIYGIKGAAIATVIGRSTGVIYQCIHLFKGEMNLKFSPKLFKINMDEIKNILSIAWPATFQFIIQSGSWIVLTKLVADTGGTEASAGYQIAIRNVVFFILPAWGLSNAAATLVGQNLGANKPERAEESVWLATRYNIYFMGLVMLLFVFCSRFIISIFTTNEQLIHHGAISLQIMGYGYIFYGISMVMMQSLNGAGDTKTPTWINFFCFWVVQIPLAYVLAYHFNLKELGAFIAIPVAETLLSAVSFYYFKKGSWKSVKV
jgi:putative MATE family efflux protein